MPKEMPSWRIDNIYPFIITSITLLLTLGSFFIYLTRLSIVETKLDMVISNQTNLSREFTEWKRQAEVRLGSVENELAVIRSHHPEIK